MSTTSVIEGDLRVTGQLRSGTTVYPAGGITDAAVASNAEIDADKMQHRHNPQVRQAAGADVASRTEEVYTAFAAGELKAAQVIVTTKPTGTSVGTDKKFTVDIQKGNQSTGFATVLSAVMTVDQTIANRQVVAAALSGTVTYAAGDTFRVIVAATGSTGTQAQGMVVTLQLDEASS